jgi:hypothetical protein
MTLKSFTTLILVFLGCVGIAYVVSWLILRKYQTAVLRLMSLSLRRERATDAVVRPTSSPPADQLGFVYAEERARLGSRFATLRTLDGPTRAALVYFVSGLCFALTMFLITYRPIDGWAIWAIRLPLMVWVFSWPTMLVWKLVTGVPWLGWCTGVALYYAIGVFYVWIYGTLFPEDPLARAGSPAAMAFGAWVGFNWGMTVAVPIFMARRVRAVGVLVLTATVLATLGALIALEGQRAVLVPLATVAAGALGWPMLRGIGALYHRRLISEQSLLVDSIWLLYGAMTAMFRWDKGLLLVVVPAAFIPFVVFKVVSQAAFAQFHRAPAPRPRKLLLLRVFALGDRSRQLFRSLALPWRYMGPIRLITGPDLATETVEPNEFLDFVGRKLSTHFIGSDDALARRVRELEPRPDFDGLYRVDELFCHDDTWAMALRALIQENHFVLMDLRHFSTSNKGCIYEVEELVNTVPLHRMMFVVDRTTDEAFLRATFADVWSRLDHASPNRGALEPRVRLFRLGSRKRRAIRGLVAALHALGNLDPRQHDRSCRSPA